jgi:large conductance mechanosensitive channel
MGMIKEFKEFAIKGNLIDTAVAFVMGAAFGKIVSAFVDGMVMPLVGMLTGGVDFSKLEYTLKHKADAVKDATGAIITPEVAAVTIKYGAFMTVVIDFAIVAFVMFMVIKAINKMKRKEAEVAAAPAPAEPTETEKLLAEIRDALKK